VEYRLVIYIQPGIVGHRLTTYIQLRNEFCNTENGYNKILSGLNPLLIFFFRMFHYVCVYSRCQNAYTFPHLVNRRLKARQPVISSHESSPL
jgi:hypothetical protein